MVLTKTLLMPDDVHNRELLANAHPPDHANPKPYDIYNLVVLGAGTPGLVATAGAAALGAQAVAQLIQFIKVVSGDCNELRVAHLNLWIKIHQIAELAAVFGARAAARQDQSHWVNSLEFGEFPPGLRMVGQLIIRENIPGL